MAPDEVVKAVGVAANRVGRFGTVLEDGAPDEFDLQRLEERLDRGVLIGKACRSAGVNTLNRLARRSASKSARRSTQLNELGQRTAVRGAER